MILIFGFREVRCRCSSGAGGEQRRISSCFFRMPCDECIRARLRRFPHPCVRTTGRAGENVRRLQTSFTIIRTVFRFVKAFPSPCMQKQARFRDYVTACFFRLQTICRISISGAGGFYARRRSHHRNRCSRTRRTGIVTIPRSSPATGRILPQTPAHRTTIVYIAAMRSDLEGTQNSS